MSDSAEQYVIKKVQASDDQLEKYRICFQKNGTQRDLNNLKWLHNDNCANDDMIYYAIAGENLAAIYTALPVMVRINGTLKKGLQSIDTLTDEHHRGKGLFIKLAKTLYKEAPEHGFSFVYGFPNANSAPGFFIKLNWISFGEAPFLLKPFSFFYFVKKFLNRRSTNLYKTNIHTFANPEIINLPNGSRIKEIPNFDTDYDRIWDKVVANIKVCVERNAAYMNWRYVNKPGEKYYRYGLYEGDELKAVIVFAIKVKHDGLLGYIMEVIYAPENEKAGNQLLKFANKIFRSQNVDAALAWSTPNSFSYGCYKKRGYFRLPEKLRPQKLYLGCLGFIPNEKELVENVSNWYISYSDSDTV